jgi:hypothetical protein
LLCVSFKSKVIAAPMTPKIKKKIIKLNYNLCSTPRIIGPKVEAVVPAMLTALTPTPTALVGKISTI